MFNLKQLHAIFSNVLSTAKVTVPEWDLFNNEPGDPVYSYMSVRKQ